MFISEYFGALVDVSFVVKTRQAINPRGVPQSSRAGHNTKLTSNRHFFFAPPRWGKLVLATSKRTQDKAYFFSISELVRIADPETHPESQSRSENKPTYPMNNTEIKTKKVLKTNKPQ